MTKLATCCITAFAFAAVSSAAQAENTGSQSMRVTARVPEHCEINASPILATSGNGVATGTVFESCNTQEGFQVVATYRPLESGERVAFNYAGNASYLHSDGWSQVANRVGAKYGVRPIAVRYTSLGSPLAISLTITSF
jgi:hypothetical protein